MVNFLVPFQSTSTNIAMLAPKLFKKSSPRKLKTFFKEKKNRVKNSWVFFYGIYAPPPQLHNKSDIFDGSHGGGQYFIKITLVKI